MSSLLEQANSRENREQFLNRLQKASGRKRHQLADHPFKPLNDLPDQLLDGATNRRRTNRNNATGCVVGKHENYIQGCARGKMSQKLKKD